MSLKENFYQALRELLNHGGLVGSDLEEKAKSGSELDSYIETPPKASPVQEASETVKPFQADATYSEAPNPAPASASPFRKPFSDRNDSFRQDDKFRSSQAPSFEAGGTPYGRAPEERTIISKNSFVDGNIRSFANVTIEGSVRGRVDVMKDVSMQGLLVGNLTCNNADMQGSSIQGNVQTKGNIFVDNDSILLGNMIAQYANIDGKIKGDVDIGSKTEFGSNAVILGDIKTGTIRVEDGANIQGFVNTAYLMEHADTAFPREVVFDDTELS
ncbi:MAG: Integral rane protein CcmA involved in cell shape determination [Oscillospiraceae bacterium]|nr:Integral rane protein CcmA involved in cell shape determination [Oscillospiraceae bacterium]